MRHQPISVEEADARITAHIRVAPIIDCPLELSAGRVLREALIADRDLPPFDRVMMDGYVVADSNIREFKVVGTAPAGVKQQSLPDTPDAALEVMTGAPLPTSATVVIPYESTEREADSVKLLDNIHLVPGEYIHRRGSDYQRGATLLPEGALLGPVEAGIAASCGYATLKVSQRPRIALFGSGDELVPVAATPAPHQIRQSNSIAAEFALALADYPAQSIGRLSDDQSSSYPELADAVKNSDVVIISGAVSRGRRDWIPEALDTLGDCVFHGVRQRPGKPMGFWVTSEGCAIFALPGNPVSTLVALHRYVLPFIARCQLEPSAEPQQFPLVSEYTNDSPLTQFVPVKIKAGARLQPCAVNNSADYARLAFSDGFMEVPPHQTLSTTFFHPWQR